MFLNRILLENYRNYTSLDINLCSDVNIFFGNNGQGKTNLLEAIFFTVIGKSFRGTKDSDIILSGKDFFDINVNVSDDITENVSIKYNKNKEKYIKVNDLYLRKIGNLMGNILAIIFSPEDMHLISEGPSIRRKFMDIAISQLKCTYYFDLIQYNKILIQKNNLIKNIKQGKIKKYDDILTVWNQQLSEFGSKIILERFNFIENLSDKCEEVNRIIASESAEKDEILKISYKTDISREILENNDKNLINNEMLNILESKREREIEREMTLCGPHKDDIDFKLNNNDIKRFGSQGQKRTAVLAVKIAELELFKCMTGRKPILLLDDVFSELDEKRQISFMRQIKDVQTFISCVDNESVKLQNLNASFFEIKNGRVVL